MDKSYARFLALILCSLIIFSCDDPPPIDKNGPTDNEGGGTDPTTTNTASLFYSDAGSSECKVYLQPQYMRKMEITVYWIDITKDALGNPVEATPIKWGETRIYEDAELEFGFTPTFTIPSTGKFYVMVRVELKCVSCCTKCQLESPIDNWEGRGKPIYDGISKTVKGGVTEVDVSLRFNSCDYCNCTEPEEYN